jgi:D-alanyl-D-alanine carboxypeptidase
MNTAASFRRLIPAAFVLLLFSASAEASPASEPSTSAAAQPPSGPQPPATHAKAAALVDVSSGRLLYSLNGDEPMKIASLTKIMTAIVAIEHGKLDDVVQVSKQAAGKEGSSIYLRVGEKITLRNLLYGLMLRSGNDAATAIAEHVGGSVGGFVYLMNWKAEQIGLAHTRFANPHGLDEPNHYSSANDLAKLAAYALHNPVFRDIVRTKVKTAPNPNDPWDYKWVNKNKMLSLYEGADGVKTGYTRQAFRCLVSSATRGGQQLAVVTLNDGDDWRDHAALLDFGFAAYPLQSVVRRGEPVPGYPYETAGAFSYPFGKGERQQLGVRLVPLSARSADYALGYRGKLVFELGGRTIGSVPLVGRPGPRTAAEPAPPPARDVPESARPTFAQALRASLRAALTVGDTGGR